MKVCLINPVLFSSQQVRGRTMKNNIGMSFYPPLGLCYITNMLEKHGNKVKIIDRNALMTKNSGNKFIVDSITRKELEHFYPEFVGITVTTPTFFDVRTNLLKMIRSIDKNIRIVVGGPHASALPEEILAKNDDIDIICHGEGEMTMLELVNGNKLEDIQGISYRNGQSIVSNQDRQPYPNIDEFCFPARHLVDMEFYCSRNPFIMHGLYSRATTLCTSRGCAFDCTFCAGKVAVGKKVRLQSPQLVIEEIEMLIKDYKVEGLYFTDDMFDINKSRTENICERLIQRGLHKKIYWNAQIRASSVDKDLLKLMKKAGCIRVDIGFESGSQRTLDRINKKTTVEQNYKAAKILHEVGLQFHANIIVGIPGEDEDDIQKTELMIKRIKPHWVGFGEFIPLPGSKLYNELVAQGKLQIDDVESMGSYNFTKLNDETFNFLIRRIRRTCVIPTRIKYYLIYNIKKPAAYLYLAKLFLKGLF